MKNPAKVDEKREPLWVTCSKCKFRFIGMYTPMAINDAETVMRRMTCPMCACTKIGVTGENRGR